MVRSAGYSDIVIQTDSMLLATTLQDKSKIPWRLDKLFQEILNLLLHFRYSIMHIYRQGNQVADFLANEGCIAQSSVLYSSITTMPRQARGLLQLDKLGIPNIRFVK